MQFVKEFVPDVLSSNFPQPYLITPKAGSRALTYASEDYHVACHYSTRGSEYGFIKEFESTIGAIVGYMDFGIENQDSPVMENAYEVPLYPGNSRLKNISWILTRMVYMSLRLFLKMILIGRILWNCTVLDIMQTLRCYIEGKVRKKKTQ